MTRTREYVCIGCGLRFRGREGPDGNRIFATNTPAADDVEPERALCASCIDAALKKGGR